MKTQLIIISITCLLALSLTHAGLAGAANSESSRLTIHITRFKNSDGMARVAVVNSRQAFEADSDEMLFR